ncbi:MAG: NAD(P)-binding domain-containing protein, partial [Actinomycetota bacterium]|nr:NAD(P)-binding domain-containing protein [Actinomycetota bacterium]
MTRVAVIGPGRVGTALAMALPAPVYTVVAVAGRGRASLEAFAARLPDAAVAAPGVAAGDADLVLVCVPDDALADVVQAVARADWVRPGSRWVHVSG